MKRVWAALGLVLALTAFVTRTSQAQGAQPRKAGGSVGQNYPNPFNPETKIPFTVGDPPVCTDGGKQHRVTLKIYNMVFQLVAIPVLQGPGTPLENAVLSCGDYTAYWDGKVLNSGREAASGVYAYRVEIDGVALPLKKMLIVK
jgi:hypothetical protein